jgi:hypothetical protein
MRKKLPTKEQAWYRTGIGDYAYKKILAGWPDKAVLKAVHLRFPKIAGTKIGSIRWYRSKLVENGADVPTNAQAVRAWPTFKLQALKELGCDPMDDRDSAD